ncbi:hypothetical protein MMC13_003511 [Lambiella insularis]|nr:hypothetical protein [Lambiella insularis]
MSSPLPKSGDGPNSQVCQDVSVRPMRLKVLYTFDDQNKTNCLARWHQVLHIRTALLDENTQIGVIELKTCIQAIVAASPELVAKLGQDYTVYAYDYSEYETPLVGQGMLSWVLASSSTTPSVPAHQSRTMVTGRVCKNILGLFSSGAQETLEVKLRLVPVPTCLQSEYIESMRKYRELSKVMPEEFDAQAWTNFLQANPGILSTAEQSRSQSPMVGASQRDAGIEHVQRLLSEGSASQNGREQYYQSRRESVSSSTERQPPFRAGSPTSGIQMNIGHGAQQQANNRADSRASMRAELPLTFSRRESIDPGYTSNEDRFEEGPAKKRAKVMKADWPGKSNFGKQQDSLRVAASTAASVRVFQPTAMRPSEHPINSLEDPPRVPTPIPRFANQQLRPPLPTAKSGLGRMPSLTNTSDYTSPYATSDAVKPTESAATSPEDARSTCTPCEPASSPPVMRSVSLAPSSPVLPPIPRQSGSGSTGSILNDYFGSNESEDTLLALLGNDIAAQQNEFTEIKSAEPKGKRANKKAVPNANMMTQQEKDEKAIALSRRQASNAAGSRMLSRTASSGSLKAAAIPASDPIRPGNGSLQRSQTWSGQQAQHPASDFATGSEGVEAPRPKSRSGYSNAKRKQAIQSKLANSIAAGEMPPFCDNCGAIETPTWRKAYSKVHNGGKELVQLSDTEGGIVACVTLETHPDGTTKLFKIIKKTLLKSDKDFAEILLCNPCGLWLHNHKCLRPESVWEQRKDDKSRRGGRKKSGSADRPDDARSDATNMQSNASSPSDGAAEDAPGEPENNDEPELPPMNRQRALSAQVPAVTVSKSDSAIDPTAVAALQRAIQSSPGRFLGTKHVPIEVEDLTPKPTRRVLFPSPKNRKTIDLGECDDIQVRNKSQGNSSAGPKPPNCASDTTDKENHPPPATNDDLFDDLFDDVPKSSSCPSSPPRSSRLPSNSFRTPTKSPSKRPMTTGDFFSSAAKAFLHPPRTPTRTPTKTKEALGELTPFTRHLNEMLSDAHGSGSPSRLTPSTGMDFLSLPPLDSNADVGSTPSRYFRSEDFDFGHADSEGVGMPSSPPGTWFGVYEDPREAGNGGWGAFDFGSSPLRAGNGKEGEMVVVKAEDREVA